MRAPVADAACGDHRHFHRLDDLLHQRERADLRGDIGLEEHAAMTAGFCALRDDRIDAVRRRATALRAASWPS